MDLVLTALNPPLPTRATNKNHVTNNTTKIGTSASHTNTNNPGRQLSDLVKLMEKTRNSSLSSSSTATTHLDMSRPIHNTLRLLESMYELYIRRGLLQGDSEKAQAIYQSLQQQQQDPQGSSGGKEQSKQKRRRKSGTLGLSFTSSRHNEYLDGDDHDDDENDPIHSLEKNQTNSTSSVANDEILLFSSLVRIFNTSSNMLSPNDTVTNLDLSARGASLELNYPYFVLIRAAANVMTAICQHNLEWMNHHMNHKLASSSLNTCSEVVYQLVGNCALPLLNHLTKLIKSLHQVIHKFSSNMHDTEDECYPIDEYTTNVVLTFISCCKCTTSILLFMGIKFNRSSKSILQLQSVIENVIWDDHLLQWISMHKVSSLSTSLLLGTLEVITVLPLTGNHHHPEQQSNLKISPSQVWTHLVSSTVQSFRHILDAFFPILSSQYSRKKGKESDDDDRSMSSKTSISSSIEQRTKTWIRHVSNQLASQDERMTAFYHRTQLVSSLLIKMLGLDHYDARAIQTIATASLPIVSILDVCEILLSFSSAAERIFLTTKSRLRDVSVENGLFSPKSAMSMGNYLTSLGHDLFQTTVSMLQSTSLRYGKRLVRLSLISLKSCTSVTVRKVVDPVSVASSFWSSSNSIGAKAGGDSSNPCTKPSLHASIQLRTRAIQSVTRVLESLGSPAIVSESSHVNLAIVLIAGSFLEQIDVSDVDEDEHWGTIQERINLVTTCLDAMGICIAVFGGYMTMQIRETIESLTITALTHVCKCEGSGIVLIQASTKTAILKLAMNCICAPWSDGGASSLVGMLYETASVLKHDRDSIVSSMAYMVLNVCNSVMTPRFPPLVVGLRNGSQRSDSSIRNDVALSQVSHDSLILGIQTSREQLAESKMTQKRKLDEAPYNSAHNMKDDVISKATEIAKHQNDASNSEKADLKGVFIRTSTNSDQADDTRKSGSDDLDKSRLKELNTIHEPSPREKMNTADSPTPSAAILREAKGTMDFAEDDSDDFPEIVDAEPDADDL